MHAQEHVTVANRARNLVKDGANISNVSKNVLTSVQNAWNLVRGNAAILSVQNSAVSPVTDHDVIGDVEKGSDVVIHTLVCAGNRVRSTVSTVNKTTFTRIVLEVKVVLMEVLFCLRIVVMRLNINYWIRTSTMMSQTSLF